MKDAQIHEIHHPEAAINVAVMMSSGKARMVTGIYQPTMDVVGIDTDKTIYKKVHFYCKL